MVLPLLIFFAVVCCLYSVLLLLLLALHSDRSEVDPLFSKARWNSTPNRPTQTQTQSNPLPDKSDEISKEDTISHIYDRIGSVHSLVFDDPRSSAFPTLSAPILTSHIAGRSAKEPLIPHTERVKRGVFVVAPYFLCSLLHSASLYYLVSLVWNVLVFGEWFDDGESDTDIPSTTTAMSRGWNRSYQRREVTCITHYPIFLSSSRRISRLRFARG